MCLKMPFIGLNSHSQKGRVTVVKKMPMYCTARPKIAPQNGSAEHVQVPGNSDLSNLACRGTMDQPPIAPIETWESLPMKLRNVEARTPGSSAYQLLPESGYWSSQSQRTGNLLTCFELFQRHLTNLPRFYKVVQEDCRFIPTCPAARCLNDDHKTKMNIHMHIKKWISIYM